MKTIDKILFFISHPNRLLGICLARIAPLIKDDEKFIKMKWKLCMNYPLNLDNPKTFNEKLQWIKLYDRKPIYTAMVDKYEAKKYVANIIGEEHIIPTIAVYYKVEDIDFDKLPNQFVLKWTHDSGGLVICKDKSKLNVDEARKKLKKGERSHYFWRTREWPYKNVKPRIIAEKYMSDIDDTQLTDYKVHNFNGIPKVILVCRDRYFESGLTEDFYNVEWEHLDISRPGHAQATTIIERPKELDEILRLSKLLAKDIPFIRSDFYIINGKVYFGELTFFPASGMKPFEPKEWDYKFGGWIKLP